MSVQIITNDEWVELIGISESGVSKPLQNRGINSTLLIFIGETPTTDDNAFTLSFYDNGMLLSSSQTTNKVWGKAIDETPVKLITL